MSEMIERVARAICERRHIDPDMLVHHGTPLMVDGDTYAPCGAAMAAWEHFARDARAAIEAMREPTTEMANAGYNAGYGALGYLEPKAARSFWARAIAAALGEPS